MKRPRRWSGRHNRWVFASHAYRCPKCGDIDGGFDTRYDHKDLKGTPYDRNAEPKKEKVCIVCM